MSQPNADSARGNDDSRLDEGIANHGESSPLLSSDDSRAQKIDLSIAKLLALTCINGGLQVFFSTVMANLSVGRWVPSIISIKADLRCSHICKSLVCPSPRRRLLLYVCRYPEPSSVLSLELSATVYERVGVDVDPSSWAGLS